MTPIFDSIQAFVRLNDLQSPFKFRLSSKKLAVSLGMVICFQSSDLLGEKIVPADREKRLKFEAEGREFAKKISTIFETECFFNLFLEVSKAYHVRTIRIGI